MAVAEEEAVSAEARRQRRVRVEAIRVGHIERLHPDPTNDLVAMNDPAGTLIALTAVPQMVENDLRDFPPRRAL